MKKIVLLLALAFAAPAFAEPAMLPSHAVGSLLHAVNPAIQIELLAVAATTQTAGVEVPKVVILTSDNAGTQSAPTTADQGLDLTGLSGVTVMLKTASAATAGGTLQAYVLNPETSAWYRVADLDLTATATTLQSWPGLWVPVPRGRIYYNPVGIGSVVTTIYLIGQEK